MKTIGNIMWFIFGGGIIALLWFIVALICFSTIIGIPLGVQFLKLANFALYPFGRKVKYSNNAGHFFMNLLWAFILGWGIAIISFVVGLVWCATIIGIPFGIQCIKLAQLAAMPFGAEIVKE